MEAIRGTDISDLEELIKTGVLSKTYDLHSSDRSQDVVDNVRKREIGLWLSHTKIYDMIASNNRSKKYSIILEDDFVFVDDYTKKLNDIISIIDETSLDFDIIFLGILTGTKTETHVERLYNIDNDGVYYGSHGYLINNKKINEIINAFPIVTTTIDIEIFNKGKLKELTIYIFEDNIINQNNFGTSIR